MSDVPIFNIGQTVRIVGTGSCGLVINRIESIFGNYHVYTVEDLEYPEFSYLLETKELDYLEDSNAGSNS